MVVNEFVFMILTLYLCFIKGNKCQLKGSIPAHSFGQFNKLRVLNLQETGIQGQIPSIIGLLSNLSNLNLAFNSFNGSSIPSEIGLLGYLEVLDLQESELGGTIPALPLENLQ